MLSPDWIDWLPLTSSIDRFCMRFSRYARLPRNDRFHDSKISPVIQSWQISIIKDCKLHNVNVIKKLLTLRFKAVMKPTLSLGVQRDEV